MALKRIRILIPLIYPRILIILTQILLELRQPLRWLNKMFPYSSCLSMRILSKSPEFRIGTKERKL